MALPNKPYFAHNRLFETYKCAKAVIVALAFTLLTGCERDAEEDVHAKLDQWFFLGQTAYFNSQPRCTGAMIHVTVDRPRPVLPIQSNFKRAKDVLYADGIAAIRIAGMTPAAITDALLLTDRGSFGKQVLAAGAIAASCFQNVEISGFLFEALNRPGATLAYNINSEGLIILDPNQKRLFYVAGSVW